MDTTDTELHPNWRALATIHLPLKRFVPEGTAAMEKGVQDIKYRIVAQSGTEVKQFYDDIVKTNDTDSTSNIMLQRRRESPSTLKKPELQSTTPFDKNKFFRYAVSNNGDELRKIYFQADDINSLDEYGWSALMMSACEGAEGAVKILLELGINRERKDKGGNTALSLANKKGHLNIVNLIQNYRRPIKFEVENDACKQEADPFYCNICKRHFKETSLRTHNTSTVHQFNIKSTLPVNKLERFNIPNKNRGLKLMVKQGWNKESGLGPSKDGRLYPVKTVIRKQRSGLGIEQGPPRVTHFGAFDIRATQRDNSDFYKKKPRTSNDIAHEKQREWKRQRRIRNELS